MFVDIIEILLRGLCVGVASSITVGPVAVLCIQRTLSKSRRSGLASGVGVACGDTLMAIIAFFFYSMLQAQIEEYSVILQVIGGIFVVIVGVYIFFQNPVPQIRKNRAGRYNLWQDFSSMFVFTLANFVVVIPYILAFFAMFNVGMDGSEDVASLLRSGATIVGFFLGAVLWWILLTLTIDLFRRRFRPRHMLTINHVAGIIIALLGIYTILSTFFTVLPHGLQHTDEKQNRQKDNHRRRRLLVVRQEHLRQGHSRASGIYLHRHGGHVPRRDALRAGPRGHTFGCCG